MSGRLRPVSSEKLSLLGEVAVLGHPRQLDHAAQLHLSPCARRPGAAEGGGKLGGLCVHAHLDEGEGLQLLAQFAIGAFALLLQLADLDVDLVQGLAQGLHQRVDRLLADREVAGRFFMELGKRLLGELEEIVPVRAQRACRKLGKLPLEPVMRRPELGHARLRTRVLCGQFGPEPGVCGRKLDSRGAFGGQFPRQPRTLGLRRLQALGKGGFSGQEDDPGQRYPGREHANGK